MSLLNTIMTLLAGGIGFIIGAAGIPAVCFIVASSTPRFIAEPIANLLFKLTLIGRGPSTIHQRDDDKYVIRRVDGEELNDEAPRKWTRWAWQKMGFSYESNENAWGTLHADPDFRENDPITSENVPEDAVLSDINRGGVDWYARYQEDGLRVRLGAALNRLKGRSNLEIASRSLSEGLKEHGGDTNDLGTKWQAGGFLFLFIMSSAMGFVVFF